MNVFTPLVILGALLVWCSGCASDLSSERAGEVDSPLKAFVQYGLDRRPEAYLVCVYQAETGGSKSEVVMHATVVGCIKGKKRLGEKFAFRRVAESGDWDLARMRGDLFYVFFDEDAEGKLFVDVQDPQVLWRYSEELDRIVEKYKRKG